MCILFLLLVAVRFHLITSDMSDFIQVLNVSSAPFFTGVVFLDVCDTAGLPPEGVVDVDLRVAVLAVMEVVLGAAVLDAAVEFLVVLAV